MTNMIFIAGVILWAALGAWSWWGVVRFYGFIQLLDVVIMLPTCMIMGPTAFVMSADIHMPRLVQWWESVDLNPVIKDWRK